jgi:hypothetical protein
MEFGKLIGDSFEYSKEGLVGHYGKWIILIILGFLPAIPIMLGIIFGIVAGLTAPAMLIPVILIAIILAIVLALPLLGYTVRIYRGEKPAPEVNNWGSLFADGLKLFVVLLIYAIPVLILVIALLGSVIMAMMPYLPQLMDKSQPMILPETMMGLIGAAIFGVVIIILVALIIWLIEATAVVRFSRTNSIGEAFNFGEIFSRIGEIGVGSYIVALIIQAIIVFVILFILELIPYIGFILVLIVTPVIMLFQARYLSLLFDSAGEEPPVPA